MVLSFKQIVEWCQREQKEFWEYMLYDDMKERGVSKETSMSEMEAVFEAMLHSTESYKKERISHSGLAGSAGGKFEEYCLDNKMLSGDFLSDAMTVALKTAESNACMRRIVAAPTAGSCGVIPAVLIPYYKRGMAEREKIVKALYVAGAIGEVIAQRASISGAYGGCQAEIGAASAMAAGTLVYLRGGSCEQILDAVAIALKGLLGLVCDPVAGLVEIPCIKRNVTGTVNAVSASDLAMAGIRSVIPADEVVDAMNEVGQKMDVAYKETALGGLANTETGKRIAQQFSEQK